MNALCAMALFLLAPAESLAPTLYQNSPVFNIKATPVDSEDVSDVLLQYYDEQKGRWAGYGLFGVNREADGAIRARIAFEAPREGVFRLRTVAVDRAGNVESMSADPDEAEVVVVYDASPPVVEMVFPRGGERITAPGTVDVKWLSHDAHPAKEASVRVLVSHDGGISFQEILPWHDFAEGLKYEVEDITTYRAIMAVEAKDLAGNVGRKESGLFSIVGSRKMETVRETTPPRVSPRPPTSLPRWHKERPEAGKEIPAARRLARRFYTRGVIYLVRGDYDEAQRELTSALQADPDYLPARIDLGVALVKTGRIRQALEFLQNSMQSYPDEPDLPYNAAVIYYNAGDLAQALELLKRVVELDPERIEALWTAADCAARLGDLETAMRWWLEIANLTTPVNRYHAKALAYLEEVGVDVQRLKALRGAELITAPAPALPPGEQPDESIPKILVSPERVAAAPEPEMDQMGILETSPAAGEADVPKPEASPKPRSRRIPPFPESDMGPRIPGRSTW